MITRTPFGAADGEAVEAFTIEAPSGLKAVVIPYGARLAALHVPGPGGRVDDVVLGFEDAGAYAASDACMGGTCGRYGGRIGGGVFTLGGETFRLDQNEGANCLHGGARGFERRMWRAETDGQGRRVVFHLVSEDGDMGFPGRLEAKTEYALTADDTLEIIMSARTDKPTAVNMIHHSYFNLAGHGAGDVLGHELAIHADSYTPVDENLLPTGEIAPAAGGPFDFRAAKPIGRDFAALTGRRPGYDNNWAVNGADGTMRLCAEVFEPATGRRMTVESDQPGVQFFTAANLDPPALGKGGARYGPFSGFTLETQRFPDAPNRPEFPDSTLNPGEEYRHTMRLRFPAG